MPMTLTAFEIMEKLIGFPTVSLGRVLDCFIEPACAIEFEILPCQKTGRSQLVRIIRIQFISCQHFAQHLVIPLVTVDGFHDPVPPVPEMLLRVPHFRSQSPPVTVSPDIHPVTPPAFSVLW